jgi:hypothetical protein
MNNIKEQVSNEYMLKLFEHNGAATYCNKYEIGNECGLMESDTDEIVRDLRGRRLIASLDPAHVKLTRNGTMYVEKRLSLS